MWIKVDTVQKKLKKLKKIVSFWFIISITDWLICKQVNFQLTCLTYRIGVRVGEYDLSNEVDCEKDEDNDTKKCIKAPVQDLQIEELIPHPNFTKKYNSEDGFNDIGLIRVKGLKMAGKSFTFFS